MDTLTHALAGGVLGRATSSRGGLLAAGLAAGMAAFPDVDAFFFRFSLLGYVAYHRGITHSFVLAPVYALAAALVVGSMLRRARFLPMFGWALLGVGSHVVLDWITSFGTMFFSPLSWHRYQLDWVFIIDFYFTGILAATSFAAWYWHGRVRQIAAAGLITLSAYIGFCAVLHGRALSRWRKEEPGVPARALAAIPQPFSPFRWLLVADHGDAVDVAFVDIGPFARSEPPPPPPRSFRQLWKRLSHYYVPPQAATIHRLVSQDHDHYVGLARQRPDVALWLRFARFPVARVRKGGRGRVEVSFEDVRFSGPWRVNRFVYGAIFTEDGRYISSGFAPRPLRLANVSRIEDRRSKVAE